MDTKYIPASHTVRDPEGIDKAVKAELQVTPCEAWDGELQITVNSTSTGRAYIDVSLTAEQPQMLHDATGEWLTFQEERGTTT